MEKMMKLKDNKTYTAKELENYKDLIDKISNRTLKNLEQDGLLIFPENITDCKDLKMNQVLLKKLDNEYYTSNIVGFIGYQGRNIAIDSRFDSSNNCYFLKYLLSEVVDIPNILKFNNDSNIETNSLDLLVYMFPFLLKKALRKGIYKTYINKQYNNNNVKGSINIKEHILKNTPFTGKIAYYKREYSYDNYVTQLIRHTIEFLKIKNIYRQLLTKVINEIKLIEQITSNYSIFNRDKIIINNIHKPICHAYYTEYRILQRLCLLILNYKNLTYSKGIDQLYGVLFDISWLWEEYNNKIIGNLFYHPRNHVSGGQRLFSYETNGSYKKLGLIYPDFIYYEQKSDEYIIADSKYKHSQNIGNNNKDFFQLLAYMYRFNSKKGLYIFPKDKNDTDQLMYLNKGLSFKDNIERRDDIMILKLGINIPTNSNNYNDFIFQIKNNEEIFKKQLIEFIKK